MACNCLGDLPGAPCCMRIGYATPIPSLEVAKYPYLCPVCSGEGRRIPNFPLPTLDPSVVCHSCDGTGVLWR